MKKELENKLIRAILIRMLIAFVLGFCMGFFMGCKSPQKVATENRAKEQKNIANDISTIETSSIDEAVQRSIEKLKSGKYGIVINHTEYDTDKPKDEATGKPPVKSDTKATISAEEESKETNNTTTDRQSSASSQKYDKTKDKGKTDTGDKTKSERQYSQIEILTLCFCFALFLVATIYLVRKFKK